MLILLKCRLAGVAHSQVERDQYQYMGVILKLTSNRRMRYDGAVHKGFNPTVECIEQKIKYI